MNARTKSHKIKHKKTPQKGMIHIIHVYKSNNVASMVNHLNHLFLLFRHIFGHIFRHKYICNYLFTVYYILGNDFI